MRIIVGLDGEVSSLEEQGHDVRIVSPIVREAALRGADCLVYEPTGVKALFVQPLDKERRRARTKPP
jgi:hypothetical protein